MNKMVEKIYKRAIENKIDILYFTVINKDFQYASKYDNYYCEDINILNILRPDIDWALIILQEAHKQLKERQEKNL